LLLLNVGVTASAVPVRPSSGAGDGSRQAAAHPWSGSEGRL